jgi:hypothetical protein
MQLTHPADTITVDFYPQAIIAGEGVKRFVKCVTFQTGQKSYSTITKLTFADEVRSRLALGYEVTDFHTEKYDNYAQYSPLAC